MEENTQINNYYIPPEKTLFETDSRDISAACAALVCAFLSVIWGFWGTFNIGWAVSYTVFFVCVTVYLVRTAILQGEKKRMPIFAFVCGGLSLALSLNFALCPDELVHLLSFAVMLALGIVWFIALSGRELSRSDVYFARQIVSLPLFSVAKMPKSIRSLLTVKDGRGGKMRKGLLGALCAVPVLCAVIPLLIRSDAAFEGLVGGLFRNLGESVFKAVLTVIIAPFLISFCIILRRGDKAPREEKAAKGLDTVFLSAFTGALNLCYLVYLFSQLAYFFSAFSGILPEGEKSYARYARRGFFELCAICGINLCVFWFMLVFARRREGKMPAVLKGQGVFLSIFTLVITGTAISKMVMYIGRYGMTVDRVYSSAFMIFTAVVFAAMLLKCFFEKVPVLRTALVGAGVVLLLLGCLNTGALTARYNVSAYRSGKLKSIDMKYISSLDENGIPYLIELADDKNAGTAKEARYVLADVLPIYYTGDYDGNGKLSANGMSYCYFRPDGKKVFNAFYEMNIPRYRLYRLADDFLEKNPGFYETASRGRAQDAVDSVKNID
ncbi:MAG: DUF4173 domain-containing protein [Clostridia bacterium]|nr:DUF4173 domain-containing protein [Clostridia bacterium]